MKRKIENKIKGYAKKKKKIYKIYGKIHKNNIQRYTNKNTNEIKIKRE